MTKSFIGTNSPKYHRRQVPRFVKATWCRPGNGLDRIGAERQAFIIEKIWRKCGWLVKTIVIEDPNGFFVVRSNLVNGLPQQRL